MKQVLIIMLGIMLLQLCGTAVLAQCSICTKTAQQMGEGPAKALNMGIVYLMLTPFAIIGYIAYRWWKQNRNEQV